MILFVSLCRTGFAGAQGVASAAAGARTAPALAPGDEPVQAYQVFMACRHPSVLVPGDSTAVLAAFCRRGISSRGEWLHPDSALEWARQVPDAQQIRDFSAAAVKIERDAVRRLTDRANEVEGNDLSGHAMVFVGGGGELDEGSLVLAADLASRLRTRIESGSVAKVIVRGYPAPDSVDATLALTRARVLAARLATDSIIGRFVEATAWFPTRVGELPAPELRGRVTVHLLYRARALPELTGLGQIRFLEGDFRLDSADYAVLGNVAAQLAQAGVSAGQPIIVTGYAPGANNDTNRSLAQARATEIRNALAELLRDR
ncbi:MAG TPA: hypothetical protein VFQ45_16665, partial [Longimicrobium sp.]|nr:hypothetical protein [Longimicrobium sp.]